MRFNEGIFVIEVGIYNELMLLYNFVIDFFCLALIVFKIKTITLKFPTIERWKESHQIAHGHLTIPRHHFHAYL